MLYIISDVVLKSEVFQEWTGLDIAHLVVNLTFIEKFQLIFFGPYNEMSTNVSHLGWRTTQCHAAAFLSSFSLTIKQQ